MMTRRSFVTLTSLAAAGLAFARHPGSDLRITRIRMYDPPRPNPTFNQSDKVITIETDGGITGIGEGGTPDMMRQLAGQLIGKDPFLIEDLWQLMYRGYFYPPGREKLHALGGLDMALWDIKAKALGVPAYELLGGLSRNYVPCYSTGFPSQGSMRATAQACIEAGFHAFRISTASDGNEAPFDANAFLDATYEMCAEVHDGVTAAGGFWAIDYHTRLDLTQAVRLSSLIEPLAPYFCEDLVRSENPGVYRTLRPMVNVPIAVGEHFGDRWDLNELVEDHLIDYSRVTLPNAGGLTEFRKIAALCETHYVGLIPHFTGPIATAALVHACGAAPGPVMMEMRGAGPSALPYLPDAMDFRDGKLWPNDRHGLGVTFLPEQATPLAELTEAYEPIPKFRRPDGSVTNW